MALVNEGYLHCMDMKELLKKKKKKTPSLKPQVRFFEIISQKCFLGYRFPKLCTNFDPSINMILMNGVT